MNLSRVKMVCRCSCILAMEKLLSSSIFSLFEYVIIKQSLKVINRTEKKPFLDPLVSPGMVFFVF
jgi:hypothetical protein